ncbi:MAG: heparinase, partial [Prevotella sp.]|nr:heparinase [Prevotella sp.]
YEIWTMQSAYHNLPRINGCSQHDGKQYAARVVSYKPGLLTLDLADAYPKEASVRWWKRTVRTQDNRRVEVTDDYSLYEYKAPTQLVLMTPVRPVADKAGMVQLGCHCIRYDARLLEPAVEDISELLDPVLQQQWGQCMYRIVLTVKNQPLKTKLKYYIE